MLPVGQVCVPELLDQSRFFPSGEAHIGIDDQGEQQHRHHRWPVNDLPKHGQHDPGVLRMPDQCIYPLGGQPALKGGAVDLDPAANHQHQPDDDEDTAQQHLQHGPG
ncbi:hypothetical protein FQZ97_1256130 [compost metagenome]